MDIIRAYESIRILGIYDLAAQRLDHYELKRHKNHRHSFVLPVLTSLFM
jgi:hypothetical protein